MPSDLLLYPSEAAAKKAGQQLASPQGEHRTVMLYALLPAGESKPTYLLSRSTRLTVVEQHWIAEHRATATKLGRFPPGTSYLPLQQKMVRRGNPGP